ncbi:Hypothetical protein POVR1_LOCUS242 [uncultured virus]|nr:Hypothetical protein POVR1_LOCUS242 [uncultured virus]
MDRVVIELLAHSDPEQAIEIAKTSKGFQKVVSRTLGEKYQWYFSDFRGFLEVYYTSVLSLKSVKYLSPSNCFAWALREGNLEMADKFFQYWLIVEPNFLKSRSALFSGLYSYACLSRLPEVLDWLVKHFMDYLRTIPNVDYRSIYSAIRSGDVNILRKVLALIRQESVIYVGARRLIYYACMSNNLEMFYYVTSHFDLSQGTDHILINKPNHPRIGDITIENVLDWNLVHTCALDTKADVILGMINSKQVEVEYVGPYELPINPKVYDLYPNKILNYLQKNFGLYDFFESVESNLDGRGGPDRYEALKKLDEIIQNSENPKIIEFRDQIISQAIASGFVNIANFFRSRNYFIGVPLWEDEISPAFEEVPKNPVSQYWYRKPLLLSPKSNLDFHTYLTSYHPGMDSDSFIPFGVSITWLADQLVSLTELGSLELYDIIDELKNDHRFDPNYRLFDLVKLVNRLAEDHRNQILEEFFEDPRIDLNTPELQELAGDVINAMKSPTVIDIHLSDDLARRDKLSDMKQIQILNPTFEKYYLMSPENLAQNLNSFQVPWIPHFNSLIAARFLSGYDPSTEVTREESERLAPASTLLRIENVIIIMKAKKLYYKMLEEARK